MSKRKCEDAVGETRIFFFGTASLASVDRSRILPVAALYNARKIDKSIAVLPFQNLSDEKENSYFADGIQDDILTNLSKIGDLKVISRMSVTSYRGDGVRNARAGHSAHLAVLHGRDVLYVVEERAPGRPPLVTDVGVRLPAQLTASGRSMLAALQPSQVRALFPDRTAFVERHGNGPASLSALRRLLTEVPAARLRGRGR